MDKEFEPEVLPAIVLMWDDEPETIILKNQGYDIMDLTKSLALSVDDEGNMYGLRPNSEGKLEWDLLVEVPQDKPALTSVRTPPL